MIFTRHPLQSPGVYVSFHMNRYKTDVPGGGDGGRRNRQLPVQEHRVRDATYMPELQQNATTCLVHGGSNLLPAFHLGFGPDAGSVGIPDALRSDGGGLADDQSGAGPLHVVFPHEVVGDAFRSRPGPGQRSHNDAVGELQLPQSDWLE